MTNIPTHDYIATAPCGCVVGLMAIVTGHEKELARQVATYIQEGCVIEYVDRTSERFKKVLNNFGHHCKPKQPSLL